MRKRVITAFIVILLCISLTGCWDSREVTELAIAAALGIDKNDKGEYVISSQILNPSENAATVSGGSGYDTPATTYTTTGRTLFEALRKMIKKAPRKVYIAHLRMIVIGENVAREGIYDSLDFLSRDHEMRTDYYIVVAKDHTAEETLKVLTSLDKIPANKLFNSLEDVSEAWAATEKVKLNDLIDDIVSEGVQPVLTGVAIEGNPKDGLTKDNVETISPKAMLTYTGMAVFRENKLVGWLNEEESKGVNYIKDDVKSTVVVFDINEGEVGIELIKCTSDIVPHIQNGKLSMDINITGEGNVGDVNTNLDLMSASVFAELTEKTNNKIKDVVWMAIRKVQEEYRSDIFGFGESIHKTNPKEWDKQKEKWAETFPGVPVNVNVDIKLRRAGTISDPFHNELKKE
jgi:spore germination protein KC